MLTEIVSNSHELFDDLVDVVISSKNSGAVCPLWVLGYAGVLKPDWFLLRLNDLFEALNSKTHSSVHRNITRVLIRINIPEKHIGIVTKYSIDWLSDNNMPIAVRAFCMHILSKIIETHPELCNEIKDITESIMPNASSGLQNAGEKLLRKIGKMGR